MALTIAIRVGIERMFVLPVTYSLLPTPRSAVPFAIGIGCDICHTFL
ncbi:MAG: hypothetical protein F6K52_12565 [Moorea sp. SIO3H5]|nr:hypothetical protein [Moorena sp. SIO3H5]